MKGSLLGHIGYNSRAVTATMFAVFGLLLGIFQLAYSTDKPNVLFLMMDDLRPNIEILRDDRANGFIEPLMHTPNLDALARKSLVLKQAYVQQAICAPSRTSMLTGRRPDTTKVYDFHYYWRKHAGNFTTLPQYFKENGYISIGMGKIFHGKRSSNNNDPISWSRPYFEGDFNFESKEKVWEAIPDMHLLDKPLVDQQIAEKAIQALNDLALNKTHSDNKPFFLAVGFHKPHMPFVFPESVLEKYPWESIQPPLNPYIPSNMPEVALHKNRLYERYHDLEMKHLNGQVNGTIPDDVFRELRRAYYCALTWADTQLGRVLGELERLEFTDNTIIVFLSDHGYHLGEHNHWTKFTNFEVALRAPMMIHIPGQTTKMIQSEQLVEFVDIFPTLVEAAGFEPLPICPEDSSGILLCREGTSFYSLISEPNVPIKKAAFSQATNKVILSMGYSIRTARFRYTEWIRWDRLQGQVFWDDVRGVELYDHALDPDENHNVVNNENYKELIPILHDTLLDGLRKQFITEIT